MLILAIDLYGIHPFTQAKRIVLKPGMNTLLGPNGSGKTMVYQALAAVLMNSSPKGMALIDNKAAQAAITLQDKDGGVHRIARDFRKGEWLLSKMNPETQKFDSPQNDPEKISAWLQTMAGGLDAQARSLLFLIDRFRLPSYGAMPETGTLPLPENIASTNGWKPLSETDALLPNLQPPEPQKEQPTSGSDKTQALNDLEKQLEAMEEEHDTLLQKQDQAKSIRNRIEQWQEREHGRKQMAEAEAKKYKYFLTEGPLASSHLRDFEEGEKERNHLLSDIEEETDLVKGDLDLYQTTQGPIWKDPLMLSGIGLIVLSFLLPFIVTLSGLYRYLFLLGVLGGGSLSAFAYYKIIRRMAITRSLKNTLQALDEKRQVITEEFNKKNQIVFTYLEKTGAKDLVELRSLQTAFANLTHKKEANEKEITRILDGQTLETLDKQVEELEKDAAALSEKLKGLEEVSREVYRLQENLRKADTDYGSLEDTFFPDAGLELTSAQEEASFYSAIFSIKKDGSQAVQREQLNQNAGQVYRFFQTANQKPLQVKNDGTIYLGERSLYQLSTGMADQVFLSLALSTLVQFSGLPFPMLLDDPLAHLDRRSKAVVAKVLQQVSKQRQIILFSTDATPPPESGHTLNLV